MGGAVKGIGNAIGGVGGAIGGIANSIPGIGPYIGPVVGGITGGPVGFATSLAGNALQGNYGGGGSSGSSNVPKYAQPSYNYGNQTYQYGSNPVDASKYFITGDKGVYNLMPALGQIDAGQDPSRAPFGVPTLGPNYNPYTPYEAYTDLSAQMANDPKALAAFQSMYKPTDYADSSKKQYVDFGMSGSIGGGSTFADLAKYASTNQNPFYIPYQGVGGKTSAFIPAQVLEAQKKAEAKARFEAMSPERQQEVIAQRQADYAKLMNRIDPNYNLRNFVQNGGKITPEQQQQIINQREAIRANVTPTPVTPTPLRPRHKIRNDERARDEERNDKRPRDNRPTPVTPTTPTPFVQGGIATLRRR